MSGLNVALMSYCFFNLDSLDFSVARFQRCLTCTESYLIKSMRTLLLLSRSEFSPNVFAEVHAGAKQIHFPKSFPKMIRSLRLYATDNLMYQK